MEIALESRGRCSSWRHFPLSIRHCISTSETSLNPFSKSFLFILMDSDDGMSSDPLTTRLLRVTKILSQSLQQNHLSFGSSCNDVLLRKNDPEFTTRQDVGGTYFQITAPILSQATNMIFLFALNRHM